jgi:hypothetical protein
MARCARTVRATRTRQAAEKPAWQTEEPGIREKQQLLRRPFLPGKQAGRNTLRGDKLIQLDMSMIKNFPFTETMVVDFLAQAFQLNQYSELQQSKRRRMDKSRPHETRHGFRVRSQSFVVIERGEPRVSRSPGPYRELLSSKPPGSARVLNGGARIV